jgi:hypothetical protein
MKRLRASNRHVGAAIGMLGVLALIGSGILAALPGTGAALRIVCAVLGYVSFVAFFRAAMLRWRRDWDALWNGEEGNRPGARVVLLSDQRSRKLGRSTALVGLIVALPVASHAQQTLFNVPSADVLDKGKVYFEEDTLWRPQDPHFAVFTVRGVYGFGSNVEGGVNLGGFTTPGRSTPVAIAAIKWQPLKTGGFALTAGAHGLFFLRGSRDGDPAGYFYAHASYAFPTNTRLTAGAWVATPGYAAAINTRGGLFAFEQKVNDHLNINADWFSGENGLGYFSPGIVSTWGRWTIYAAYSLKNGDSKGNALLLELGFNF